MTPLACQAWLDIRPTGRAHVVRITAWDLVDEETAVHVALRLVRLVDEIGYRQMALDLGGVKRAGSMMIAKLVGLQRRLHGVGGRLVLCNVPPALSDKLNLVLRLTGILEICSDEHHALEILGAPSLPDHGLDRETLPGPADGTALRGPADPRF